MRVRNRGHGPTQCGIIASPTRCTKGGCKLDEGTAYAGRRLKLPTIPERRRLESQSSSRTGENPPYGMIGRIEETSASFEARSAPRSYPTTLGHSRRSRFGRESACPPVSDMSGGCQLRSEVPIAAVSMCSKRRPIRSLRRRGRAPSAARA